MARFAHLVKRAIYSFSDAPISTLDMHWVTETLTLNEFSLWQQFNNSDKRHSITVSKRFNAALPLAGKEHLAGVMLHDIGKIKSNLSTIMRVFATLVGPRGKRFSMYHDHEQIGVRLLEAITSDRRTISILDGTCEPRIYAAFLRADDI